MLPLSSGIPPSAPHTGQVAFTTSGVPTPATYVFSHRTFILRYNSLLLSVGFSDARNF
jgi:hypothetical protein